MSDLQDSNRTTTTRDETIIVVADGETGSGVQAGVTSTFKLKTQAEVINIPQFYLAANQLYSLAVSVNMANDSLTNPLVLFRNPAGSGKTVYIHKIAAGVFTNNTAANFRVYPTPTITANGTATTIHSRFINNGAASSAMLVTTLPTVTISTYLADSITGQNTTSLDLVTNFSMGVAPGGSFVITGQPSSNNRAAEIEIAWAEI